VCVGQLCNRSTWIFVFLLDQNSSSQETSCCLSTVYWAGRRSVSIRCHVGGANSHCLLIYCIYIFIYRNIEAGEGQSHKYEPKTHKPHTVNHIGTLIHVIHIPTEPVCLATAWFTDVYVKLCMNLFLSPWNHFIFVSFKWCVSDAGSGRRRGVTLITCIWGKTWI